jgi:hypothetical protein
VHADRRATRSQNFPFNGDVEGSSEGCFPRAVLAAFTIRSFGYRIRETDADVQAACTGSGRGGYRRDSACATLPPIYSNHITIFLSPETYAAVLQSAFLRDELSAFQERTVQRDGGTWSYTEIFISGQHTYLELFKAGQFPNLGTTIPGQIVFNMWIDNRRRVTNSWERRQVGVHFPEPIAH